MRTRLSIHISILAFVLVLWQLQSVLAQKYYMNFAFNNNNPDAEGNGPSQELTQPGPGERGAQDLESVNDDSSSTDEDSDDDSGSGDNDDDEDDDDDEEGSGDDDDESADDDDSGSGDSDSDSGDSDDDDQSSGVPGVDDDNDDSDSQDNARRTARSEIEENNGPDNDHSHHSSYEISIDDSFGGRYVRSIYESSESHGHSGSNPGSGSMRLDQGDSSSSKQAQQKRMYGDDDYEEVNED